MTEEMILWRRVEQPGHEAARVVRDGDRWRLEGTAVFAHEGEPCRLDYRLVCENDWRFVHGRVSGWMGGGEVALEVQVDGGGCWWLNGEEAPVSAAWLRFPGFQLERLEQVYRRTGPASYRYESAGGAFVRDLEVTGAGLVTRYPGLWEAETGG